MLSLSGCPVERDQDQPAGLREVVQRREGLREGVQVQGLRESARASAGRGNRKRPAGNRVYA